MLGRFGTWVPFPQSLWVAERKLIEIGLVESGCFLWQKAFTVQGHFTLGHLRKSAGARSAAARHKASGLNSARTNGTRKPPLYLFLIEEISRYWASEEQEDNPVGHLGLLAHKPGR